MHSTTKFAMTFLSKCVYIPTAVLFQAVWGKDLPSKADFSQRLMLTKAGLATSSARSSAAWLQFCQKCGFIGGKKRSFSKWGWNYRTYKKNISEKHLLRESLLHVAPSALFVGKYGWLSPNLIWELFLLGVVLAMAGTKSHSFSSCSMESPCSVGQYLQFLCWVQIELTIFF